MYSSRLPPPNQPPSSFYNNNTNDSNSIPNINHFNTNSSLINQIYVQQQRTTHHQQMTVNQLPIQPSQNQLKSQPSSIQATPPQINQQISQFPQTYLSQSQQRQQLFTNTSLLGLPPDHQILNQQIALQNSNYHQHASSLITLTGSTNNPNLNLTNQNRQLNANNTAQVQANNIISNNSNTNKTFSQQTNKPAHRNSTYLNKQNINNPSNTNHAINNNNNNNNSNNASNRNRYQKSNTNISSSLNNNDSEIYKQNLKKSIDANRRNINQRLNVNQQNKANFKSSNNNNTNNINNSNNNNSISMNSNQYSLINSTNSNNVAVAASTSQYHSNKQLIVIKPTDDLFDNSKSNKSNKRSHPDSELIKIDLLNNELNGNSKKLNSSSSINHETIFHHSDLVNRSNESLDDKENLNKNSIIKLQGNLVEMNQNRMGDEKNLVQVKLEVFYCKLCMLTLYDDKFVKEHLDNIEHKTKLIKAETNLDVNNNQIIN